MYILNNVSFKVIEFKENSLKHHIDFQYNEWFLPVLFHNEQWGISIFLCNL